MFQDGVKVRSKVRRGGSKVGRGVKGQERGQRSGRGVKGQKWGQRSGERGQRLGLLVQVVLYFEASSVRLLFD